jgi:hypothetical protein
MTTTPLFTKKAILETNNINKENILHYQRLILQTNKVIKKDVKIMMYLDLKKANLEKIKDYELKILAFTDKKKLMQSEAEIKEKYNIEKKEKDQIEKVKSEIEKRTKRQLDFEATSETEELRNVIKLYLES